VNRAVIIAGGAVLACVAAVLVVLALGRPPDAALSTSSPASGARMPAAPTAISLTFTAPLAKAHLAVSSAATGGTPVMLDHTVTMPVTIGGAGRYVVAYHVTTMDGSELSGSLPFTISTGAGDRADAALPAPELPELPEEAGGAHRHGELSVLTAAVVAVNAAAGLAVVVLLLRRRPRSPGTP